MNKPLVATRLRHTVDRKLTKLRFTLCQRLGRVLGAFSAKFGYKETEVLRGWLTEMNAGSCSGYCQNIADRFCFFARFILMKKCKY